MLLASAGAIMAGPVDDKVSAALSRVTGGGWIRSAAGVTRSGAAIPVLISRDDLDYSTRKTRVLLVGGMDGSAASVDAVLSLLSKTSGRIALSALPIANPEAFARGGGAAVSGFPPQGEHYGGKDNAEAQYLWRWIGMHAPDAVVVIGAGGGLADALSAHKAGGTGTIPAFELPVDQAGAALAQVRKRGIRSPSAARVEIQRRVGRNPLEVARQLSAVYGRELPEAVYIPAMALVARLRLGEAAGGVEQLAMVEKIVEPYFTGARDSMAKATGSHLSGHLLFGELYAATRKPRYLELARKAADTGFQAGAMLESMPMHSEMSDAVFMGCPIVAQVGRLTGDRKYFDMALRHMRFMLKLNLRKDGLHRHSPLDETAWGRGNGFPALGLALTLSELPESFEGRAEVLSAFRAHMAAMLPHQDPTGAWHQVVDRPESYRELTVTSMMLIAMRRGVARGWLDKARFQPAIDRAWYAIKTRVAADGSLVDVCTGTGKQKSLRDYYDRGAILGPDPRGGAMAFLAAMEMAAKP